MSDLTAERLRGLLHYDPETGVFRWRYSRRGTRAGSIAGSLNSKGYRRISVDGRQYKAQRLAFLWMLGRWPADQVDFRDGVRHNTAWSNLREATQSQNNQNVALSARNTSGYMGVSWNAHLGKWRADIAVSGKSIYLGCYADPAEAHAAYLAEKAELHTFQPVPRQIV